MAHKQTTQSSDPSAYTAAIRTSLRDLIDTLRKDVKQVNEPRAQALFETSAEVLQGLMKTYDDYDAGKELAFQRPS